MTMEVGWLFVFYNIVRSTHIPHYLRLEWAANFAVTLSIDRFADIFTHVKRYVVGGRRKSSDVLHPDLSDYYAAGGICATGNQGSPNFC